MSTNPNAAIPVQAENLSFAYGERWILHDVTFSLPQHAITCIVGPNGGGKTTLLRLCLGLIKPTVGTLRILGTLPKAASRRVGYTPQQGVFDPLFPITAQEVVLMGRLGFRSLFGRYSKADHVQALNALADVGLADMGHRSFHNLSGGQRQRTLIARALVSEPEILFLDEPTANVDPKVEDDLLCTLDSLKQRMTIVLVSHDLGFVAPIVKTVLCINQTAQLHATQALSPALLESFYGHSLRHIHHGPRCHHGAHGC